MRFLPSPILKISGLLAVVASFIYAISYYRDPLRTKETCVAAYGTDLNKDRIEEMCVLAIYANDNKQLDKYEDVYRQCKRETLMQLRSPSTATLDNISIWGVTSGNEGSYTMNYTVDADNALGGTIRNYAFCIHNALPNHKPAQTVAVVTSKKLAQDIGLEEEVMISADSPLRYKPKNQ